MAIERCVFQPLIADSIEYCMDARKQAVLSEVSAHDISDMTKIFSQYRHLKVIQFLIAEAVEY